MGISRRGQSTGHLRKDFRRAGGKIFKKEGDLKPHQVRYWLNPKVESAAELEAQTAEIGGIYEKAQELAAQGIKLYATDECTGMQAKERLNADRPMKKGKGRGVEFEYIRHGTLALIANFEIATGRIESSTIKETRTEADFAGHLRKTVAGAPQASGWWFVMDQLNTHQSASLVTIVAEKEEIKLEEIGEKGKSGILRSMKTRKEFLERADHQIRFIYTPKHCSWLNQIEIWFSILAKKLLKWGNFKSKVGQTHHFLKSLQYS